MKFLLRYTTAALLLFGPTVLSAQTAPPRIFTTYVGPYSSTVSYFVNDMVTAGGATYISLQKPNLNNPPASSPAYWQALSSVTGPSGVCAVQTATELCITSPPYSASTAGATTTTITGAFTAGVAGTVQSCSTFAAGNGISIAGAGVAGARYVGTVAACSGTLLSVTPATATAVSSGALVQHDETAAIQSAINFLGPTGGAILFPDGVYKVNGPLQDTSGANAILKLPSFALGTVPGTPITFRGATFPVGMNQTGGAIISSDLLTGNVLGGFISSGPYGGFISSYLQLINFRVHSTQSNPCAVMVNATFMAGLQLDHVWFDSAASGTPTCTTGAGAYFPTLSNDVLVKGSDATAVGFYALARFSEHAAISSFHGANSHLGFVMDTESGSNPTQSTWGNTINAANLWCQLCDNLISAGVSQTTVNLQVDAEVATQNVINDPNNLLYGNVWVNVPYTDSRSTSTPTALHINGGANLNICNLKTAQCSLSSSGGSITSPNPGQTVITGYYPGSTLAVVSPSAPAIMNVHTTCTTGGCYEANTIGTYPRWLQLIHFGSTWAGDGSATNTANTAVIQTDSGDTGGLVLNTAAAAPVRFYANQKLAILISGTDQSAAFTSSADVAQLVTGTGNAGPYQGLANAAGETWYRHVLGTNFGSSAGMECQWGGSAHALCWNTSKVALPAGSVFGFASGVPETTALDNGFSRLSAGHVALGNGAQGDTSGTLELNQILGPATAPTGSCPDLGAWVSSRDGHLTYCNGGTWVTKI